MLDRRHNGRLENAALRCVCFPADLVLERFDLNGFVAVDHKLPKNRKRHRIGANGRRGWRAASANTSSSYQREARQNP
ncbi:MAG: hypothetical protein QHJ82_15580 [Verrucomicrobiota bacterium]|nr:hypothetical protein [Verrucomicrobiota bacterium]